MTNIVKKTVIEEVYPTHFLDYKNYLQSLFLKIKSTKKSYTLNQFGTELGFSSMNTINQILKGRRPLSTKAAKVVIQKLSLKGPQRRYFEALVEYNNAISSPVREKHFRRLMDVKSQVLPTQYDNHVLEFFSRWYHVIIRDMVDLYDFDEDPTWIAKRIYPNIRPEQARESFELLKKLGFIRYCKDEKRYIKDKQVFSTGPEVKRIGTANFHQVMIDLGKEAVTRVKKESRDISAVTLSIPKSKIMLLKSMIHDFQQQLLNVDEETGNEEVIFQVNIQAFPVTNEY